MNAPTPQKDCRNTVGHFVFWIGGLLIALAPYVAVMINPDLRASWMLKPGNFADNITTGIPFVLIGATLGGWIWFFINRVNPFLALGSWWHRKSKLNWIWYLVTASIYAVHNLFVLSNYPFDGLEFVSAALGRVLTAFVVIALLWLITQVASLAAPHKLRLIPWFIPAVLPGFIGADTLGIIFWKNTLRFTVNRFDEDGPVNITRQLQAGGFEMGVGMLFVYFLIFLAILTSLCFFSSRLSQRINPFPKLISLRPRAIIACLIILWAGICVEKASGFLWKSRQALRWEYNTFEIHLTPFEPALGVAKYKTVFKEVKVPPTSHTFDTRPDIFFFILESVRADSLEPEHAPFLCRFRDEECQQLGTTWAASNATHLSWYSIFNGQLPLVWGNAIDIVRETKLYPASPWINILKTNNYQMEARAVCDLTYNGMASTNFGLPHQLKTLIDYPAGGKDDDITIPSREIEIISQARESLKSSPMGGNFHVFGLDSPHFVYHWHKDFTPPYSAHDPAAQFHAYPTADDITRVKNRYYNAIAWTDHQIKEFVDFLKEQGRYDNSIIVITGDHGEEFHEHGSWFHCSSLEKEQTSVPLLIKWPKSAKPAPAQVSASHLDVLPSLLDYLGVPAESYSHLPGRSLLKPLAEEATQICLTSYSGITGIAMAWQRGEYTATFRWKNSWNTKLPAQIHLDDITGPDGSLFFDTPVEWDKALRAHFPDAADYYFSEFTLEVSES